MSQSAKVEALRTILPLLHLHHGLIQRVVSQLGSLTPSPPEGPPRPPDRICNWRCWTCKVTRKCEIEEPWLKVWHHHCKAYRVDAVARVLEQLSEVRWVSTSRGPSVQGSNLAAAVYTELVEPWPEWNPMIRERWCEDGLEWMADHIPGRLEPFRPDTTNRDKSEVREAQIAECLDKGWSYKRIQKYLRCSPRDVAAVSALRKAAQGDTSAQKSAGS